MPANGMKVIRMIQYNKRLIILTIILILNLFLPPASRSEFYKYVTEKGAVHYVDDLPKVPEKYLDQIKTYRERYDHLPESERSIMLQKDLKLDEERSLEENKLLNEREKEALKQQFETDVIIRGNQVLVPVTIGHGQQEQEALFLLDTGATHLVLFKEFANQFSLEAVEKGVSKVAGGGLVPSELVVLDYVKVGPLRVNQAGATVIANVGSSGKALNFSGLLGMNILRNIEYTIDFENRKIRWKPKS